MAFQGVAKSHAGEKSQWLIDLDCSIPDHVGEQDLFKKRFYLRVVGKRQHAVLESTVLGNKSGQSGNFIGADIIPQPGPCRVQGCRSVDGHLQCFSLVTRRVCPAFKLPPFLTVGWRHENMVIFKKFAVTDQHFSDVKDFIDPRHQPKCFFCVIHPQHITVREFYGRSLNGIHRHDSSCFSGSFNLHLRADRKEIIENMQGRRMETCCRKARIATPAQAKAEPSFPHRIREHRATPDKIRNIFVLWFDLWPALFCLILITF